MKALIFYRAGNCVSVRATLPQFKGHRSDGQRPRSAGTQSVMRQPVLILFSSPAQELPFGVSIRIRVYYFTGWKIKFEGHHRDGNGYKPVGYHWPKPAPVRIKSYPLKNPYPLRVWFHARTRTRAGFFLPAGFPYPIQNLIENINKYTTHYSQMSLWICNHRWEWKYMSLSLLACD